MIKQKIRTTVELLVVYEMSFILIEMFARQVLKSLMMPSALWTKNQHNDFNCSRL